MDDTSAGDEEVVIRARDTYFMAYWLALVQRLMLLRANAEIANQARAPVQEAGIAFENLRASLLQFALSGQHDQISSHAALQRFYRICLDGVDGARGWQDVYRHLQEVDALRAGQRQTTLATEITRGLGALANMQRAVRWVTALIVSLYLAILYHLVVGASESVRHSLGEGWGELFFAALGLAGALFVMRRRSIQPRGGPPS
jgi:hypothetical protein